MGAIAVGKAIIQQLKQQQRILQRRQTVRSFVVGVYSDRDTRTPTRKFVSPSGSTYYTQKISGSKPEQTPPVIVRGAVGRVGVYDQR